MNKFKEVEVEFMLSWIVNNPKLFQEQFNKFFEDHPSDLFEWHSFARKGYITLIAVLKDI